MLLAILTVAPGFVDWTPYRETFARQLSGAINRPVTIEGNVSFVIVPRPALEAGRVRIEDGPNAVAIDGVRALLAFMPLLAGDLHFRDLQLEHAVGSISVDLPWNASPAAAGPTGQVIPERVVTAAIDRVSISGGDLTLRTRAGETLLRAQGMDIALSVDGRDRYRLDGDLTLNGEPMSVEAQLGARGGDGVRALAATARVPAGQVTITASGRVSLMQRTFDGDVMAKADRGGAFGSLLGWSHGDAPALVRPLTFAAKTSADESGFAFNEVTLDAGGTSAKGVLEWRRARTPQLTVRLDFAPFALEDWRRPPASATRAQAAPPPPPPPVVAAEKEASPLTAEIALRFPAFSFRGQSLRDGSVTASLAKGELTVSDISATLPGSTRLNAFGLVSLAQASPSLDGIISLQTFDARTFLGWLGANVSGVSPGRLGSASLQGALQGTLDFLEFNDIEGTLDTARIGGRLSYAPRARPFVGVDLRIENANLDSYRGASVVPSAPADAAPTAAKTDVYGVKPSGTAYAGLGAFDAEVHLQVEGVTAGGLPGGRVGLDLGLKDAKLEIRTASFEKIAGTTAWLSGAIGGLGTALQFESLQFDLAGDDIARLASLLEVDLPPPLASLGTASLTGTLNGGAVQADISAILKVGGLTARAGGQIMDIEHRARFNGQIEASHPRFSEFMRAASYAWPANIRDPGALALSARIAQESEKTTVSDLRASVGKDRLAGTAQLSHADGRTMASASFTDVLLDLDRIFPPEAREPAPTRSTTAAASAAPASPWSQEEITWSFLKGWSGDVSIAGPAFAARGLSLQDFSGRVLVADDAAELADWQGKIFGAPGELSFRFAASPEPAMSWQVVLNRADFRSLVAGLNGGRTNLKSSGTADLTLGFSTHGSSAAELVAALSGGGTLRVTATESGGGLTAGLLGPLNAAAQLDVVTPGKPAPITFSTRLTAANGIVKLENAEVSSRSHTGRFAGAIDLARRQVDVTGTLVPRKPGEDQLPIAIRGAMNAPNIRLLPPPKK